MIEKMKFARQNPVQSYTRKKLSGRLLDQAYISTEQHVAPHVAWSFLCGLQLGVAALCTLQRDEACNVQRAATPSRQAIFADSAAPSRIPAKRHSTADRWLGHGRVRAESPESPRREALVLAELSNREALLRDSARLGQPWM